jgi:hypothetical protein
LQNVESVAVLGRACEIVHFIVIGSPIVQLVGALLAIEHQVVLVVSHSHLEQCILVVSQCTLREVELVKRRTSRRGVWVQEHWRKTRTAQFARRSHPKKIRDRRIDVERSHRTDKDEFYQLLSYRDDVDLNKKLAVWERFYNFDRPHGAHGGKTPYEALPEKLS